MWVVVIVCGRVRPVNLSEVLALHVLVYGPGVRVSVGFPSIGYPPSLPVTLGLVELEQKDALKDREGIRILWVETDDDSFVKFLGRLLVGLVF